MANNRYFGVNEGGIVTLEQAMQVLSQMTYIDLCEFAGPIDADADKLAYAAKEFFVANKKEVDDGQE